MQFSKNPPPQDLCLAPSYWFLLYAIFLFLLYPDWSCPHLFTLLFNPIALATHAIFIGDMTVLCLT